MFFFKLNFLNKLKKESVLFKKLNLQRFDYSFFFKTQSAEQFSILFFNLYRLKEHNLLVYSLDFSIDIFFKKFFFIFLVLVFTLSFC